MAANIKPKSTPLPPLHSASAAGDATAVHALLARGADPNALDADGWTAMEHAAYRGYLRISGFLMTVSERKTVPPLASWPMARARDAVGFRPWEHEDYEAFEGVWVWVVLGSLDASRSVPVVEYAERESEGEGRSLSVFADGDEDTVYRVDLPVKDGNINAPWLFKTRSLEDLRLVWKLESSSSNGGKEILASGIALAKDWDSGLADDRESLRRGARVALQADNTGYVGCVNYSYFSVTPFPPPPELKEPRSWRFGNGVGGHRGSGKNRLGHNQLQIGENTIQSFQTAVDQGAAFLEFDVQLTKDHVPVIYHDVLLSELGNDARMHDLTFEQLSAINTEQGPRPTRERRSNSVREADTDRLDALSARMANTTFNKTMGFKANTRGNFIREDTCSLGQFLRQIGKDVPLNLEIKYPMLFETADWSTDPTAIKANTYANTILAQIYTHHHHGTLNHQPRPILFSSFNPEICIALATKQRTWPVFFLSKTLAPKGEKRSQSVAEAVAFAEAWGLKGVVVEATPLVQCPGLVGAVKGRGLRVVSFGAGNSDVGDAEIQFEAGIDAVITDTVGPIVKFRRESGYPDPGEEVWP